MVPGLGIDFQEVAARIQSYAAQFLGTKQQLFQARDKISSLISQARDSGYVEISGRKVPIGELNEWYNENARLLNENMDLERKFLSAMEELKTIKGAMEESAEIMVGIPGLAFAQGLDAVPVATIAWATGAAILIGSITYFMSRVKTHLDRLAGATAGSLIGIGTIALIAGGAYLLLRGK